MYYKQKKKDQLKVSKRKSAQNSEFNFRLSQHKKEAIELIDRSNS